MYDDYLLLIDEIDKMACKDQTFLLNLMETGIVSEAKHHKTRTIRNVKIRVIVFSQHKMIDWLTDQIKLRQKCGIFDTCVNYIQTIFFSSLLQNNPCNNI
jgi:hypothetical protein